MINALQKAISNELDRKGRLGNIDLFVKHPETNWEDEDEMCEKAGTQIRTVLYDPHRVEAIELVKTMLSDFDAEHDTDFSSIEFDHESYDNIISAMIEDSNNESSRKVDNGSDSQKQDFNKTVGNGG